MAFGFFSPEEVASPAQMALRQRIALQMLANSRRSAYPKNVGEGLSAIGDAIGERGQLASLEAQMKAYEDAKTAEKRTSDSETPTPGKRADAEISIEPDVVPRLRTATVEDVPPELVPAERPAVVSPPPQRAMVSPPPQISPMQQQAALTPTEQPQAFFPSTPQTASSAGPSQLALSPPPRPNEMVMRNPIPAMRDTAMAYDLMPPVRAGGPRSELAGPMNDAQSAQMAELMGRPARGQDAPVYPPTASLDAGAGVNPSSGRDSIAQALMTARGVPQPNPTIGAATPPTIPADPGIRAAPPVQLAQAGPYQGPNLGPLGRQVPLPPDSQMPPRVPPSGTPATPIPPAPEEPRAFVPPSAARPLPEPAMPPRVLSSADQLKMEQRARDTEDADLKAYYNDKAGKFEADRAAQDTRNMEKWKADHQAWEQDRARLHQYYLDTPTREQTIKKGMDEAQARERAQKIEGQLGGIPTATWLDNLKTGKEQTAGIPAATQSIKRARDLVENNKMFFGTFADTNTTLAKVMSSAGFPLDPKASGTEQFKQSMGGIMQQARKAIVGPGAQSDREMDVLRSVTGADAKLTPQTIKAALDAAERLNLMMALQHQKEVRQFAGEDDPNRKAAVYRAYGVPNMADLVPQASVNKLFQFSQDPQVHKDFDNTYHTPGLSREVLRFRRPQ